MFNWFKKENKQPISKSHIISTDNNVINLNEPQKVQKFFKVSDNELSPELVNPPYDAKRLYEIFEDSSLLEPNIAAMEQNIAGLGYHFSTVVEKTGENTTDTIRNLLYSEILTLSKRGVIKKKVDSVYKVGNKKIKTFLDLIPDMDIDFTSIKSPSDIPDDLILAIADNLYAEATLQRIDAEAFFNQCGRETSYMYLKKMTRRDLEIVGNAYWEVIRDGENRLKYFIRVMPDKVRISRLTKRQYTKIINVRTSPLVIDKEEVKKRVRAFYVDVDGMGKWFKEFGVKEVISSKTGILYKDIKELYKNEKHKDAGNEIIHFKLPPLLTEPYGVPRWIGALLEILGNYGATEYNYKWFEEGILDPLALLVNGGTLSPETVHRIKEFVKNMKGVKNSHKVLILESTATAGQMVPQIKFEPMKKNETDDGSWLKYQDRNDTVVGSQFRLPEIIRGVTKGQYNRATAESALRQADEQVFEPERKSYDWEINRLIMPELGINLITYVSNRIDTTDISALGDFLDKIVSRGVITPKEARDIAEKVLGYELPVKRADWMDYPLSMVLAGIAPVGNRKPEDTTENMSLVDRIRNELRNKQGELASQGLDTNEV